MRYTVPVLALACAITFAAGNAVVAPQQATSPKPQATVVGLRSPVDGGADAITIPQMLSYQGMLTDTLGVPVPNGNYPMMFLLYTTPSGGSSFWSENQSVTTKEGLFSVLLGSSTPIGSMPEGGAVYLATTVSGGPELTPRFRIVSSAFAYLSERAANADMLQGKDTSALDARYVVEGQVNSVTSAMLVDGTIAAADLGQMGASSGQVMKWTGSAWAPRNDSVGGGGAVTSVGQDTGIVCVPNPITSTGNVKLDLSYGDGRYVNEGQANSVTGAMITDGQVASADIRDTTVNTADVKDDAITSAKILDGAVTSIDIRDTTVNTADLKDAAVTMAKLNQAGAASGQIIKWTGSAWAPLNDSVGVADNAWVRGTPDSVLYTVRQLGIVRGGASNVLYGSLRHTHTDFGVGCTTGYSSGNYGYMAIGGGQGNRASYGHTTVSGGLNNRASMTAATVGGGSGNTASGDHATVGGGSSCDATWIYATVGGGRDNTASNSYSTVGGGRSNSAVDAYATVAGGWSNTTSGDGATVGGGYSNYADSNYATIGGGDNNSTSGYGATVGGGRDNNAVDDYATIGGGYYNYAGGPGSTIPGGYRCYVYGDYATVIGGADDSCGGDYSLVAGRNVRVRGTAPYTFAFGENCSTSTARAVVFYHSGAATRMGVGVQNPTHYIDVSGGSYCDASGWHNPSSRELKRDIARLTAAECQAVLQQLMATDVVRYRYKQDERGQEHIGLIAEEAPGVLTGPDRKAIGTGDAIGFLMAAVKAQQAEIEALKSELKRR